MKSGMDNTVICTIIYIDMQEPPGAAREAFFIFFVLAQEISNILCFKLITAR